MGIQPEDQARQSDSGSNVRGKSFSESMHQQLSKNAGIQRSKLKVLPLSLI